MDNNRPPWLGEPHRIPNRKPESLKEAEQHTLETAFALATSRELLTAIENLEQLTPPNINAKDAYSEVCQFNTRRTEAMGVLAQKIKGRLDQLLPGMTNEESPAEALKNFSTDWEPSKGISWPDKEKWKTEFNKKSAAEQREVIELSYAWFVWRMSELSRIHSYEKNPETQKLSEEEQRRFAFWQMRHLVELSNMLDFGALKMPEMSYFLRRRQSIIFDSVFKDKTGKSLGDPRPSFGYADFMCGRVQSVHGLDGMQYGAEAGDYCARGKIISNLEPPKNCSVSVDYLLEVAKLRSPDSK